MLRAHKKYLYAKSQAAQSAKRATANVAWHEITGDMLVPWGKKASATKPDIAGKAGEPSKTTAKYARAVARPPAHSTRSHYAPVFATEGITSHVAGNKMDPLPKIYTGQNSSTAQNTFLSELGREALKALAAELGLPTHGHCGMMKSRICRYSKSHLRAKLDQLDVHWMSSMHKADLQRLICNKIMPQQSGDGNNKFVREKKTAKKRKTRPKTPGVGMREKKKSKKRMNKRGEGGARKDASDDTWNDVDMVNSVRTDSTRMTLGTMLTWSIQSGPQMQKKKRDGSSRT